MKREGDGWDRKNRRKEIAVQDSVLFCQSPYLSISIYLSIYLSCIIYMWIASD